MKSNYHTHVKYCKHATGEVEDYVLEAIEKKLDILGFSDHSPLPNFILGDYKSKRMDIYELQLYLSDIDSVQEKYSDKILILKGLEIEYFPKLSNFYDELLFIHKLDYLILGHHLLDIKGELKSVFRLEGDSFFHKYATDISNALQTKKFKILAHPDVFLNNYFEWNEECIKCSKIIIEACLKNDVYMELNINGMRRGNVLINNKSKFKYPRDEFWELASKYKKLKIIIGSDCHNPFELKDEFYKKGLEFAKKFNIKIKEKIIL